MTAAQTAPQKAKFHPQLEAIFDDAQDQPVLVDIGERKTVILSDQVFGRAQDAAKSFGAELKFNRVDRGENPAVVIVLYEQIEELREVLDLAIETR